MKIRKCSPTEARLAAQNHGSHDEHDFKRAVVGSYYSISECDIFIDTSTRKIYVGNKDETNLQDAYVTI